MSIICGYINSKNGTPVVIDDTSSDWTLYRHLRTGVRLTTTYWPIAVIDCSRESFLAGIPYRCERETCLILNWAEALALGAVGAAVLPSA